MDDRSVRARTGAAPASAAPVVLPREPGDDSPDVTPADCEAVLAAIGAAVDHTGKGLHMRVPATHPLLIKIVTSNHRDRVDGKMEAHPTAPVPKKLTMAERRTLAENRRARALILNDDTWERDGYFTMHKQDFNIMAAGLHRAVWNMQGRGTMKPPPAAPPKNGAPARGTTAPSGDEAAMEVDPAALEAEEAECGWGAAAP